MVDSFYTAKGIIYSSLPGNSHVRVIVQSRLQDTRSCQMPSACSSKSKNITNPPGVYSSVETWSWCREVLEGSRSYVSVLGNIT